MTRILSIIVLFFLFKIDAQNKDKVDSELKFKKEFIIDLEVGEISEPGNLFIAIWNNSLAFKNYKRNSSDINTGIFIDIKVKVGRGLFKKSIKLPKGVYLISLYVDSNFNNKFDYNFLGIPKEQYGFSNNEISKFRKPKFSEASFELKNDLSLKIKLRSIL